MKRNCKTLIALLLILALTLLTACTSGQEPQQPEPAAPEQEAQRDDPDTSGGGAGQPEPQTEPEPASEYAEYNAAAEKAYREALQTFVDLGTLPGTEEFISYSEYADGEWTNMYAIMDIDGDGKDELVWRVAQTIMASMQENIYSYDEETGELVMELGAFPTCEYYREGLAVQSGWSHGTGAEGPDFWPFNVFYYNEETDTYDYCGYCAQACLEAMQEMGWADRFPAEYDLDGDGIIYEISNETTGDLEWVDEDSYQFWFNNMFSSEPPVTMPWNTMDEFVHPNG